MNRIPPADRVSRSPIFYKRIFPALWFGALLFMTGGIFFDSEVTDRGWALAFAATIGLLGFGIIVALTAGMVDEVLDGGDYLRIRRGQVTRDVPLQLIEKVSESFFNKNPPQIELVLKRSRPFGGVITFIPIDASWLPFVESRLTRELRERVAHAQREATSTPRP